MTQRPVAEGGPGAEAYLCPMPSRADLKTLARLSRRKHREGLGLFLVEGVRAVEAAVEAGAPLVRVLATPEAAALPRIRALVKGLPPDVPAEEVDPRDLARIAETEHAQGVLAVVRRPASDAAALDEALDGARRVVVLDGVQDPGNAGTIVRAAAWFGADAVVAGPGTADLFMPKTVRATMGALWAVRCAQTADLAGLLDGLRARGLALWGAALDGQPAHGWQPAGAAALVLGSEGHGLSDAALARLDGTVRIGGGGRAGVESLNVGVAAGVLLHAWLGGEERGG